MRVLVTGKDGQVGRAIAALAQSGSGPSNRSMVLAGRAECDLSRPETIRSLLRQAAPEVVVNAAAYTAVDQAERERDLCFAVNAEAPGILAEETARRGALLIHYSTDYVFDGAKADPYLETDPVHPLGVYGASKAAGEEAVAAAGGRYLILRTSWVYGPHGKNFLLTMLRLGREREELRVVDDQTGSPTSAAAIAAATLRLLERYGAAAAGTPSGIYHMTAAGATSWCGFARAIFEMKGEMKGETPGEPRSQAAGARPQPRVTAIATADYPTPAKRPQNSVLSNRKFEDAFGFHIAPWREQLAEVLAVIE